MRVRLADRPFFLLVIIVLCCCSCRPKEEILSSGKYALYLLKKDNRDAIILLDNLDSTYTISLEQAVPLDKKFDRNLILHAGYYYRVDAHSKRFTKYQLEQDGLQAIADLPMEGFHIENFQWIDQHTLLLLNLDNIEYAELAYKLIDIRNFTLLREGPLQLPYSAIPKKYLSIGFSHLQNNRLMIGYSAGKILENNNYSTLDSMYTALYDFEQMQLISASADARSTYPGGINTVQTYNFTDQNGDFYLMSCPGIALGNSPHLPTAIFRIKNGQTHIDPNFMINISQQINNHAYGMWSLGKHEVLIRSERKDLYTDFSNHHNVYQFEYYRINLLSQEFTKLALPLDKGTRKENVLVDAGKVYIGIDDENDQHQIWVYDITTKKLHTGARIQNSTNFILRIDRF